MVQEDGHRNQIVGINEDVVQFVQCNVTIVCDAVLAETEIEKWDAADKIHHDEIDLVNETEAGQMNVVSPEIRYATNARQTNDFMYAINNICFFFYFFIINSRLHNVIGH